MLTLPPVAGINHEVKTLIGENENPRPPRKEDLNPPSHGDHIWWAFSEPKVVRLRLHVPFLYLYPALGTSPYIEEPVSNSLRMGWPALRCLPPSFLSSICLHPLQLQQVTSRLPQPQALHPDFSAEETWAQRKPCRPGGREYVTSKQSGSHFAINSTPKKMTWREGGMGTAETNSIYLFYAKFSWCLVMPAFPQPFNLCFHFILRGLWLF